jgi:hypothetical protein
MTSRITIEVDFDNNNQPYIQILHPVDSDDVRDKLIKQFLQKLGHTSSWLKIRWSERHREGEARVIIEPITPNQLAEESKIMIEQVSLLEKFPKQDAIVH